MDSPPTHPPPEMLYACGFSLRKRNLVRQFLPECSIRFVAKPEAIPEGAVAGVVFAASSEDPQTGYALTADQVRGAAAVGAAASSTVGTGRCA